MDGTDGDTLLKAIIFLAVEFDAPKRLTSFVAVWATCVHAGLILPRLILEICGTAVELC